MQAQHITLDTGLKLWTVRMGAGEPVLIPNGVYFIEDLQQLAGNFTLIAYDPRNRGKSDRMPEGDIHIDVEDMEAVRQHLGIERLNLLGHSYMGLVVALYAMRYPEHMKTLIQIGPSQPFPSKQYPPELAWNDGVAAEVFGKLGQLQMQAAGMDPVELCTKASAILATMCVADAANAAKINWARCDCENERMVMKYFSEKLMPSIQKLEITPQMFAKVTCPVLTIHGRKDRNAPYGGGVDWANSLPNTKLLTVENAGHAPWLESPETVLTELKEWVGVHQRSSAAKSVDA